jgi:hypothetical protein
MFTHLQLIFGDLGGKEIHLLHQDKEGKGFLFSLVLKNI